jgi:putative hydrolase of the HAD superfamily
MYDYIFKSGIEKLYDTGKISSEEFYHSAIDFLKIDMSFENFSKIWNEIFFEKPEMNDFIASIDSNKYKKFILSNTNELHFEYCMNHYPIMKSFDGYFLSYKLGMRKPELNIYEHLIKNFSCKPEEILFIDDKNENVMVASKIGIKTIEYTSHSFFLMEIEKILLS